MWSVCAVAERGWGWPGAQRLPRKALPGHASCAATEGPGQALSFVVLVQSPSCVWPSMTPWTVGHQSSLSFTISQSLFRFMSIESVMLSNHLIFCHPLLLLPSIFSSIRVFFPVALRIRWPKYWSFSFSISPSNEYSGLISFRIDWFDLLAVQGTLKSLLQNHQLSLAPPEMQMCECWELIL